MPFFFSPMECGWEWMVGDQQRITSLIWITGFFVHILKAGWLVLIFCLLEPNKEFEHICLQNINLDFGRLYWIWHLFRYLLVTAINKSMFDIILKLVWHHAMFMGAICSACQFLNYFASWCTLVVSNCYICFRFLQLYSLELMEIENFGRSEIVEYLRGIDTVISMPYEPKRKQGWDTLLEITAAVVYAGSFTTQTSVPQVELQAAWTGLFTATQQQEYLAGRRLPCGDQMDCTVSTDVVNAAFYSLSQSSPPFGHSSICCIFYNFSWPPMLLGRWTSLLMV